MLHPEIDWENCQECSRCEALSVCKPHALMQIDPGDLPYIDYPRCTTCGQCVQACSFTAIMMINNKLPNVYTRRY